jgi:hypothetical protein
MSKIPAPLNLLNRLPKNLLLKKRVPSTPTMTLAPLARELLYCCILSISFSLRNTHISILIALKRKKKKNLQFMERLLRAPLIPWFFRRTPHCCGIFASPSAKHRNIDSCGQPPSTRAEESKDWGWRQS